MNIYDSAAPLSIGRRVLCGVLLLLIFLNMWLIFGFSAETGAESGARSAHTTRWIVSVLTRDFDQLTPAEQDALVEAYHPIIRKLAHFTEFALLGFLCGSLMFARGKGAYWLWWVIPAVFCLLYAISDEVHQIFTGRGPAVTDVMIDFAGSLTGLAFIHLACTVINRIKKRRIGGKEEPVCRPQDTV